MSDTLAHGFDIGASLQGHSHMRMPLIVDADARHARPGRAGLSQAGRDTNGRGPTGREGTSYASVRVGAVALLVPTLQRAILLDDIAVGTHLVQARERETTLDGARFPPRRPQPIGAIGALIDRHGTVVEQAVAAMAAWRGHLLLLRSQGRGPFSVCWSLSARPATRRVPLDRRPGPMLGYPGQRSPLLVRLRVSHCDEHHSPCPSRKA